MSTAAQINDVLRQVSFTDTDSVITLTQTFPTTAADLWEACTSPDRLARWFEPVEGDLRPGGRYRMSESGTAGTIEACDAPRTLAVTWEYDDDVSRVTATIEETGPGTASLTVSHHSDTGEHWQEYGPAAGGCGWDAAFLGLRMLLESPATTLDDVTDVMSSPEGQRFVASAAEQWWLAHQRAGASSDEADAALSRALAVEREMWAGTD